MRKVGSVIALLIICGMLFGCSPRSGTVVLGAKDYTEQYILGNILALLIENNTNMNVTLKTDLASDVIFAAIRTGVIDAYVDYTGTVYGNYLSLSETKNPIEVFDITSRAIRNNYDLHMYKPLGFDNSYGLAVRYDIATEYGLRTISDLAEVSEDFVIGGSAEFLIRSDGVPNLKRLYEMRFSNEIIVDGIKRYSAVSDGEIQVTEVFTTDGHLLAHSLVILEDDRHFFLPYQGVVIVRDEILEKHPELQPVLEKLSGLITDEIMRSLNYRVDVLGETPEDVAESFLRENNLII